MSNSTIAFLMMLVLIVVIMFISISIKQTEDFEDMNEITEDFESEYARELKQNLENMIGK